MPLGVKAPNGNDHINMTDINKFDTCKFRSKELVPITKTTCCSSKNIEGYVCFKLRFEDVKPELCKNCIYYQIRQDG